MEFVFTAVPADLVARDAVVDGLDALERALAFLEDPDPDGLGFDDGSGTIGGYLAASF